MRTKSRTEQTVYEGKSTKLTGWDTTVMQIVNKSVCKRKGLSWRWWCWGLCLSASNCNTSNFNFPTNPRSKILTRAWPRNPRIKYLQSRWVSTLISHLYTCFLRWGLLEFDNLMFFPVRPGARLKFSYKTKLNLEAWMDFAVIFKLLDVLLEATYVCIEKIAFELFGTVIFELLWPSFLSWWDAWDDHRWAVWDSRFRAVGKAFRSCCDGPIFLILVTDLSYEYLPTTTFFLCTPLHHRSQMGLLTKQNRRDVQIDMSRIAAETVIFALVETFSSWDVFLELLRRLF